MQIPHPIPLEILIPLILIGNLQFSAHDAEFSEDDWKSASRKNTSDMSLLVIDYALNLPIEVHGKLKIRIQSVSK